MSARRQWVVTGGVAAALVAAAALFITMSAGRVTAIGPGAKAPRFNAVTVPPPGGSSVAKGIADYRGQVVLLNIWATWCGPCREEMPRIETLHRELGAQGLTVIGISVDNPGMEDPIREFVKEVGISFPVLYDASGKIRDDYQTAGVPETFLIDREGVIRRRLIGSAWTVDDQRSLLKGLLGEPAPR